MKKLRPIARWLGRVGLGIALVAPLLALLGGAPGPLLLVRGAVAATVSVLKDLSDVSASLSPGSGQVLTFTGGQWNAATPDLGATALPQLSDVNSSLSPANGQILSYSGGQWTSATPPSQCSMGYELVSDNVSVSAAANGSVTVNCTSGKSVLGGGCTSSIGHDTDLGTNRPSNGNGWLCSIYNDRTGSITLTAYAVCGSP